MRKLLNKNEGFTLLELVIVIAIIAILISIAAMKYSNSSLSAQAAAHNSNVRVLKSAGILFLIDNPEHNGTISDADLKDYLEDGRMPKPAKSLQGASSFTVNASDGDVLVQPGLIKVKDKKLVLDNDEL